LASEERDTRIRVKRLSGRQSEENPHKEGGGVTRKGAIKTVEVAVAMGSGKKRKWTPKKKKN